MLNKMERMEKLNAMGINTGKYFSVDLDNGTKIHLFIDENGDCKQVKENDPILDGIIADGYVRNSKLHRRFVMAQMFYALNYVSYDGKYKGYNDYIKTRYDYIYTIKMMTEEVKVLSKLEVRDRETFLEREHFFNKETVAKVLEDYLAELKKYIDKLPTKKCEGTPYKRVKGTDIFISKLDKKLYRPIRQLILTIMYAENYTVVYNALCKFKKKMVRLPYNTKKSKAWLDAYKGAGAYYTLLNLTRFHNCKIYVTSRYDLGVGNSAESYLKAALEAYKGEGWRMFALMKKVIEDNNFDFKKRMEEIYK